MIGGGSVPKPGEVSLAHNGVLFLDEMPEFKRDILELLRQPLEDGQVTIARSAMSVTFPSRFVLVSAMNPCPCGYYSHPQKECRCTPLQIRNYLGRISGPLLDRIDIHIEVPPISYQELSAERTGETSHDIRERVTKGRQIQRERYKGTRIFCNAQLGPKELKKYCPLDQRSRSLLQTAISRLGLSARAYDRVIKVARTISDLACAEMIDPEHISEAILYRSLDREFWGE
jgi:magnesium chelatase family protein